MHSYLDIIENLSMEQYHLENLTDIFEELYHNHFSTPENAKLLSLVVFIKDGIKSLGMGLDELSKLTLEEERTN